MTRWDFWKNSKPTETEMTFEGVRYEKDEKLEVREKIGFILNGAITVAAFFLAYYLKYDGKKALLLAACAGYVLKAFILPKNIDEHLTKIEQLEAADLTKKPL